MANRTALPLTAALVGLALLSSDHSLKESVVILNGELFRVELAITDAERRRGLMQRDTLEADRGMLFFYRQPQPVRFWNKDVRFPIDILYFDPRRRLLHVDANVPPCPQADDCPVFETNGPVQYVLELPGGTAKTLQARPGALMEFAQPGLRGDCRSAKHRGTAPEAEHPE